MSKKLKSVFNLKTNEESEFQISSLIFTSKVDKCTWHRFSSEINRHEIPRISMKMI